MPQEIENQSQIRPKLRLSEALASKFQHRKLKAEELESIRAMAEGYQNKLRLRWPERDFVAYQAYFGFLTALKAKSVVRELLQYQYLKDLNELEILEIGPGTLGASLGIVEGLSEHKIKVSKIVGIDPQETAFRWAKNEYSEFLPRRTEHALHLPKRLDDHPRLIVCANVINELEPNITDNPIVRWLETQFKEASGKNLFVFIEPAEFEFNQKFLSLRDRWREMIRILLPCTHAKTCPALAQNEWCHEERPYEAPSEYWNMIKNLGFRQRHLSFSLLVLGKRPSTFQMRQARVVSSDVSGKGLCERWLCQDGRRWKQSNLLRERSDKNQPFYESLRGDVISLDILEDTRQPN